MSTPASADTQVNVDNLSNNQEHWEKRYKETQAAYTRSQQALAEAKAKLSVLEEVAKPTLSVDASVQAELDDLKYRDPDAWRDKLNALEVESKKSLETRITEKTRTVSELERRQLVLDEFTNRNPGFVINDDVIAFDLPKRITAKLEKGEVSFEDFLEEAKSYLETPKVVGSGAKAPQQPNLSKVGGDGSPTKHAVKEDTMQSYKKELF